MGHSTDIDLLRKRMASSWKAGGAGVPLLYDNDKAGATLPPRFIRFSVRPSEERKRNLGNDRNRVERQGRVWVQVAIPIGVPDAEAWALADKVSTVFARWRSLDGALHCQEIETSVVPDDAYYIIAVKVIYRSTRVE